MRAYWSPCDPIGRREGLPSKSPGPTALSLPAILSPSAQAADSLQSDQNGGERQPIAEKIRKNGDRKFGQITIEI